MKSSLYIAILLRSSDSKTAGNLDLLYFTGMGLCFFVIVDANQQDRSAKLAECFGIIPAFDLFDRSLGAFISFQFYDHRRKCGSPLRYEHYIRYVMACGEFFHLPVLIHAGNIGHLHHIPKALLVVIPGGGIF